MTRALGVCLHTASSRHQQAMAVPHLIPILSCALQLPRSSPRLVQPRRARTPCGTRARKHAWPQSLRPAACGKHKLSYAVLLLSCVFYNAFSTRYMLTSVATRGDLPADNCTRRRSTSGSAGNPAGNWGIDKQRLSFAYMLPINSVQRQKPSTFPRRKL